MKRILGALFLRLSTALKAFTDVTGKLVVVPQLGDLVSSAKLGNNRNAQSLFAQALTGRAKRRPRYRITPPRPSLDLVSE